MGVAWKVAVVEDDRSLSRAVISVLKDEGYIARAAHSAGEGLALVEAWRPDLVLLDVMLPDSADETIFTRFRAASEAAVVGMTAKAALADRVAGLKAGADDYVTKPFAVEELLARVQAVIRRTRGSGGEAVRVGDLEVEVAAGRALLGGRLLDLTATEFRILTILARRPGTVVPQGQIVEELWPVGTEPESNAVEVHVGRLRKKLEATGAPRILFTVRGMGYTLREVGP